MTAKRRCICGVSVEWFVECPQCGNWLSGECALPWPPPKGWNGQIAYVERERHDVINGGESEVVQYGPYYRVPRFHGVLYNISMEG